MADERVRGAAAAFAQRVRRVVSAVVVHAVRESGAAGVVIEAPDSPEGVLLRGWLAGAIGEARVWQMTDVRAGDLAAALVANPVNKTALLLGGRPPAADLLPLADLSASRVAEITGAWSAPAAVERLAVLAGGIGALDAALVRMVEGREPVAEAAGALPADAQAELLRMWNAGHWYRMNPRVVPKLTSRTWSIDLFD